MFQSNYDKNTFYSAFHQENDHKHKQTTQANNKHSRNVQPKLQIKIQLKILNVQP